MSYTRLYYHIVFRPKNSQRVITEQYETELYKYIWGICKNKNCHLIRINGMPDHIHLLVELPPHLPVSDFVRDLKSTTSVYMKSKRHFFPYFEGWGKSYCAFSYGKGELDKIVNYIKSQKIHHAKLSYEDEIKQLLNFNGIPYAEECLGNE